MGDAPTLNLRVTRAIQAAGVAITGVSIGDSSNKATWRVTPPALQAAAQAVIDAFDPNDASHEQADLDAQAKLLLDQERIFSALVWTILDTYPATAPATPTKYNAARTKIIAAYKAQPWKA